MSTTPNGASPPRILYVVTRAERGGAQTQILELFHATQNRYTVALATGEEGFLADEARKLRLPVFPIPSMAAPLNPVKDLRALRQISAAIRAFQPDLIHAHSSKAGLLARAAARLHRIPCIFTAHGWAFSDGVPLVRKCVALPAEWIGGRFGATTIAVSRFDHDLALRYKVSPADRITTILVGKSDHPGRAHPRQGDPPIVTMVARFGAQKDHLTLLRALSGVQAPFRLWLIGDGPLMDSCRAAAQQLGVADKTSFLGNCNNVPDLLCQSHLFALISRYEGLPGGILEAMRAALPVVATDTGGVSEAVHQGRNGLLVARGDHQGLRVALEQLLSDPALRGSMGDCSRAIFEQNFSIETMVARTFDLYQREIARGRAARAGSPGQ